MIVSTHSRSAARPSSAWACRFLPFEFERLRDDRDRQSAQLAREARNDRRRARAGSAAKPCRDEDHVGAGQRLNQAVGIFERGFTADVRVGAGAEPLRQLSADLNLDGCRVPLQRLCVGVGDDELDTLQADLHHPVDGVAAAAADSDHFDTRAGADILGQPQTQRGFTHFCHSRPPGF